MAENPFLEIIDDKQATEEVRSVTTNNPFLPLIDARQRDNGVVFMSAMQEAANVKPDVYAKQSALSKRTGLPVDVVNRNQDTIEVQAPFLSGEYDELHHTNPLTVSFLSKEDNAKWANDDVPQLTVMEQIAKMNDNAHVVEMLGQNFMSGLNQINVAITQTPGVALNFLRALNLPISEETVQAGFHNPVTDYYRRAADYYATDELQQDPIQLIKDGNGAQAARSIAAQVAANLPQQAFLIGAVLAGQPQAGLGVVGGLTASHATAAAVEAGKTPLMAALDGVLQGGIESATEMYGTVGIVKHWESALAKSFGKGTAKQILSDAGKSLAAAFFGEGSEEFVAEFGQAFSDYITGNENAFDNITHRMMNAFLVGGVSGGVITSPTVLTATGVKAYRSAQDGRFWDETLQASEQSKLRQRNPEKYEAFVNEVLDGTGKNKNIYIPIEALQTFFQNADGQNDQAAFNKFLEEMEIKDQLAEAAETGKEFEISAAKFAAKYAGSDLSQALRPDIRFNPEGMTQREQTQVQTEYTRMIQEMQAEYAQLVEDQKLPHEIDAIRDKMILPKKDGGAGISAEEADAQLKVFSAGLMTFARKAGVSFEQYVRQINPVLNVGGVPVQGPEILNQEQGTPEDFEVTPEVADSINWKKVNTFMRRKGYDFRGADDAKAIFENRIIQEGKVNASVFPDHAAALEYAATTKKQSLETKAKRTFGVTRYFEEAGYITSDGQLLDFSGRKDGYQGPPARNVDHREIHRVYPEGAFPEDTVGTANMIDFMNRGNIRLQSNGADISTVNPLTSAQERVLARHIRLNQGDYILDFSDQAGYTIESKEYDLGTSAAKIINDIREFFKSRGSDQTFYQTPFEEPKPRGSVQFTDTQTIINLYESANLSTFLHESGHVFMREMQKLAESGIQDEQLQKDFATLKEWVGGNIASREAQEKLARGFEAYLREGKAPAVRLADAFRRFRDWLSAIYRTVRGLNVEINDEIRGVFDRILASETEIDEAKQFYAAKKSLVDLIPVTPEQRKKHTDAKKLSDDAALEKAVKQRLNLYLRLQGGKQAIREQATKEVDAMPVYQAIKAGVDASGLDLDIIRARYGEVAADTLRNNHEGLLKKQKLVKDKPAKIITIEQLAADHGFESPDALMEAMTKAARRSQAVTNRAREILQNREQELLQDLKGEEKIPGEEALHNDKSLAFLITEAAILAERIAQAQNRRPEKLEEKLYRAVADEIIAKKPVRFATRYDLYARAEQRFARQAEDAILKGDFNAALLAKKKQLLNHALVQAAIKARDEKLKIENFFKAKNYKAKLASTENDFAEAAMDLTSTYALGTARDLVPKIAGALKKIYELDEMLAVQIPDWVLNKQKPADFKDYRDLTMAQFRELNDAIHSILQFGSDQMKSAEAGEAQTRQEWVDASVAIMQTLKDRQDSKLNELRQDTRKTAKAVDLIDGFVGGATMMQFLSDWMDNFQFMNKGTFGPFRTLYNKVLKAETQYHEHRERVLKKTKTAWDFLGQATERIHKQHGKRITIPGLPVSEDFARTGRKYWTVNRMIAILLNTGNDGNMQALQRGLGITQDQIQKVAGYFTSKELRAIQTIWDAADILFPELDETHFSIYNRHLPKVDPQPISFTSNTGETVELKGGYHPLVFDHKINDRAAEHFEADMMKNQTQAVIRSSKPEDGMTYARKPGHSLPPLLDTSVWFTHINNTARYITHARILRDLNLITRNKEWQKEFKNRAGQDHYKSMRSWLQYNANPTKRSYLNNLDRKSSWLADILRSASTAAILGLKNAVGIKQRTSMVNAAQALGKSSLKDGWKWILQAYRDVDWKTSALGTENTKSWKDITKRSAYMRSRDGEIDREISDLRRNLDPLVDRITILGKKFTAQDIQDFAYFWIKMNDRATVSIVWTAAYNQFIAEKADANMAPADQDKAAIAYANGIVQDTQPSSLKTELSELQRAEGWLRLFTSFMTYTLKYGNRVMQHYRAWNQGAISNKEFFNHVLQEQIIQAYTAMMITVIMGGGDLPEWWELLLEPFAGLASWIPIVRDVFSYYKYGTEIGRTPLAEAPVRFAKAAAAPFKFIVGDQEFTQALWDIGRAIEIYYKVPVLNTVQEFKKVYENLTD